MSGSTLKWKDSYLGKTQSPGVRVVEALIADVDVDVRKDSKIDRPSRMLCLTIVFIHDFWSFPLKNNNIQDFMESV